MSRPCTPIPQHLAVAAPGQFNHNACRLLMAAIIEDALLQAGTYGDSQAHDWLYSAHGIRCAELIGFDPDYFTRLVTEKLTADTEQYGAG